MGTDIFSDYAKYYDAFYADKAYEKEASVVDTIIHKYGKSIKDIIIFGCGTGKHDRELARLGYNITGIDASAQMVDTARKNALLDRIEIQYDVADIREYSSSVKFDAVVSLFHVMSYQTTNNDIISAFSSARGALNKGGILLFDAWYGPGVLTTPPAVRIKEAEIDDKRLIRLCRPSLHVDTNIVDVNYDILIIDKNSGYANEIKETHYMRYIFRPEMELMLRDCGFELLANLDCENLGEADCNSWTAYFVCRAV